MRLDKVKHVLAQVREGSFILCVDSRDCKWAIYRSKRDPDSHEEEKQVIFTDEPHRLPDDLEPIRYKRFHDKVMSNRYDYDIEGIGVYSVRAVYQDEEEMLGVARQFRDAEQAYVDAVEPFRARFAVLAKMFDEVDA